MATVIVGFDPGSARSGYGVIDVAGTRAQPILTFLGAGDIESTGPAVDAFFSQCAPLSCAAGQIVAVEVTQGTVYGLKGPGIVPHLLSCARADSLICENLRWRGIQCVGLPAVRWRLAVCGKGNPDDAEVAVCVHRFVRGMPKRSNKHNRDALGVAIAVAMGMRE